MNNHTVPLAFQIALARWDAGKIHPDMDWHHDDQVQKSAQHVRVDSVTGSQTTQVRFEVGSFDSKMRVSRLARWRPTANSTAILRLLSIVLASPAARLGNWMTVLGLVSVAVAALLLLQVRDYKRMFA